MQSHEPTHPIPDYTTSRRAFRATVGELVGLSVKLNGTPSCHGREYWSSIVLAKLVLTSMTLDRIIPKSASSGSGNLWDLGSIATLVRGLAENYLLMVWLCVQTEIEALWKYRITALTIVDNRSRYRMTAEVEGQPEPADFVAAQQGPADKLSAMPLFQALEPRRQREILKGDKLPFIQDDVIASLGMDQASFRRFYRYLSAFVHTGTISFFRMEDHGRGNGEHNAYEERAMIAFMEFTVLVIRNAVADIEGIHAPHS